MIRWTAFMKSLVGCNTNHTIQFCLNIKMSNGSAKSTLSMLSNVLNASVNSPEMGKFHKMSARTHFRKLAICDVTEKTTTTTSSRFVGTKARSCFVFFNHLLLHFALLCCTDSDIEQLAPSSGHKKSINVIILAYKNKNVSTAKKLLLLLRLSRSSSDLNLS